MPADPAATVGRGLLRLGKAMRAERIKTGFHRVGVVLSAPCFLIAAIALAIGIYNFEHGATFMGEDVTAVVGQDLTLRIDGNYWISALGGRLAAQLTEQIVDAALVRVRGFVRTGDNAFGVAGF